MPNFVSAFQPTGI